MSWSIFNVKTHWPHMKPSWCDLLRIPKFSTSQLGGHGPTVQHVQPSMAGLVHFCRLRLLWPPEHDRSAGFTGIIWYHPPLLHESYHFGGTPWYNSMSTKHFNHLQMGRRSSTSVAPWNASAVQSSASISINASGVPGEDMEYWWVLRHRKHLSVLTTGVGRFQVSELFAVVYGYVLCLWLKKFHENDMCWCLCPLPFGWWPWNSLSIVSASFFNFSSCPT